MGFFVWLVNYIDRFFIDYYNDKELVGIYSANYSLGSKIFILLHPIFLIPLNKIVYGFETKFYKKKKLSKSLRNYLIVSLPILIFCFLFYNFIGNLFLSNNYSEGFVVIPLTAASYLILTISYFIELFFYEFNKTKILLRLNLGIAILNVLLNIILVPSFGIYGAICSTFLAFSFKLLYSYKQFLKIK